jgi:FlaA1/EpsC-like NDP-sugar epimerase
MEPINQSDPNRYSLYFLDVCGIGIAFLLTFILKNGWEFAQYPPQFILRYFIVFILMTSGVLGIMGADIQDLRNGKVSGILPVLPKVGMICILLYPLNFFMSVAHPLSKTFPILLWFVGIFHLVGLRIMMMMYWDRKDTLKKQGLWGNSVAKKSQK